MSPEIPTFASEDVEISPTLLLNQKKDFFFLSEDFTALPSISSASFSFNTPLSGWTV